MRYRNKRCQSERMNGGGGGRGTDAIVFYWRYKEGNEKNKDERYTDLCKR